MKKSVTFRCEDFTDKMDSAMNDSVIGDLVDQYVTFRRFGRGTVKVEFDSDTKEIRIIPKALGSTKITFVDYEYYV